MISSHRHAAVHGFAVTETISRPNGGKLPPDIENTGVLLYTQT